MALTGQLGTPNSLAGNIEPGIGEASVVWSAVASLAGISSLSANAEVIHKAIQVTQGQASLSATATVTHKATSAVNGQSTLNASFHTVHEASANLHGNANFTALPKLICGATTQILAGAFTTPFATIQANPTAQIQAVSSVTATGIIIYVTGTLYDLGGNSVNPLFSEIAFTGAVSLTPRSIFVDKGPIAKAPNILQTGIQASVVDPVTISLADGNLDPTLVGLMVTLSGGIKNGGTFLITSVLSATQAKVAASFTIPDASLMTWQIFDPRDGEIADEPSDVTVTINGVPTVPESIVGLLGQIVLSTAPVNGDEVLVNYNWVQNPVVDLFRLNSKEFRLNSWNRDLNYPSDLGGHKYRYNNTLVVPSEYVPDDERAPLAQPLQRDLKYRAYDRAYTTILNDPNTLLLNSPTNKIAFPPLQRPLSSIFVNYQATGLPQNDPVAPWTLHGTGTATIVSDELVVVASSGGAPFPTGQPIFWTRPLDLTFPHVFASSWRLTLNSDPTTEGVFTGVASGFSDGEKCLVVGFLDNGGTPMIGILQGGAGNDPSQLTAWIGGLDSNGDATNAPVIFDWSTLHSYRIYQDQTGNISVFVDGGVVATLLVSEAGLPFLSDLNEPFNQIQGIYFGALSRLAVSTSTWDFLRYEILPINPEQVAPSIFVSYNADNFPEEEAQPWTPIGAHGTETLPHSGLLILDSTSATDQATEVLSGLIDGDFRGFDRIEPLLSAASSVALDVNVQLLTWTQGITPNAVMVAIDDATYLIQLCFFADQGVPLFSYGGRSFPDQFEPYTWTKLGGQTPTLVGQYLHISDTSISDGLIYYIDDNATPTSPNRVVSLNNDYVLEFRAQVISHTPDPGGFSGVNAEVYDSYRDLGILFLDVSGTLYVALHSEGVTVARFSFNWNDGNPHTYRLVKNTAGNLVTLFVDTVLIGMIPYSNFSVLSPSTPVGVVSFGSSTPQSTMSLSVVNWAYCNVWRVNPSNHYVGIWKGTDPNALTGYHLPLKAQGQNARVSGNALEDLNADFVAAGVLRGDYIVIDLGLDKGVYEIASVAQTVLTVAIPNIPPVSASATIQGISSFEATVSETTARASITGEAFLSATATVAAVVVSPTPFPQAIQVNYRIPLKVDWTYPHKYRIVRDPSGGVALFIDTTTTPVIDIGYNNIDLPPSSVGLPNGIAGGMPSIVWGAFDPTNLSQTAWQYVRYGITRPVTGVQIVPPHQVLNQRNVVQSYERHLSNLPHTLTDFWSESEGITPQSFPDFLQNPGLTATTLLNEGTPLVPSTQTYEVRRPTPVLVPVVGLNNPQDILNSQAFVMNESEQRVELIVPNDVLYNSLQVIERDTGSPNLIAPFNDESQPYSLGPINYQNEVCLSYDAETLPEQDPTAITPWTFQADDPANVVRTVASGVLTYGTNSSGAQTVTQNSTPLLDSPSLTTQVTFRLKLLNDASLGLGDTQVRFGLSAPGMTASLAFVTMPEGQRYVLIIDQNNGAVVGGIQFDFDDGQTHTYQIVRNPTALPRHPIGMGPPMPGMLQVFVDP